MTLSETSIELNDEVGIQQDSSKDNNFCKEKEKNDLCIQQNDKIEEQYNDQKDDINGKDIEKDTQNTDFPSKLSFHNIRDECLRDQILFEDPDFVPSNASLFLHKDSWDINDSIEWKRASQMCDNAQFFIDGATRFDIKQGELGDCWLLAAMANLTLHKKLLHKVVPPDQSFTEGYTGVFHFK